MHSCRRRRRHHVSSGQFAARPREAPARLPEEVPAPRGGTRPTLDARRSHRASRRESALGGGGRRSRSLMEELGLLFERGQLLLISFSFAPCLG